MKRFCLTSGTVCLTLAIIFGGRGSATSAPSVSLTDAQATAAVISAPRPEYPFEARRKLATGSGVVVVDIDVATGLVTRAYMAKSTGERSLDNATISAFKRWRFQPGTVAHVQSPITFTIEAGRMSTSYEFKQTPMDDALAHYLGKGTVIKGPLPSYPSFHPWTFKSGQGVYELHAGADGHVREVKILKSSGDETFDKVVTHDLGKWVLARGPLIIELPLRFVLTPEKFSIKVAR